MIQGWGMTETSPLATLSGRRVMKRSQLNLSEDEQFENVAKAGQLMPGLELDIFDEEFNRLPHDGETVGKSSFVGHGSVRSTLTIRSRSFTMVG